MEEFPVEGTNTVSEPPKASNYRVEKDAWEKKTPRLNKNLHIQKRSLFLRNI